MPDGGSAGSHAGSNEWARQEGIRESGHRTSPPTRDPRVDRAIEKLDQAGVWHWVRRAALRQAPETLSEDEQLALVLTEIGHPRHPHHYAVSTIAWALGKAEDVLEARDASAAQGRLTLETWSYWTWREGRNPARVPDGVVFRPSVGPPRPLPAGRRR